MVPHSLDEEDHDAGHHKGDHDHADQDFHSRRGGHEHLDGDESVFDLKSKASPLIYVSLENIDETVFKVHAHVDISVDSPGDYLPMASLQYFLTNTTIHGHLPYWESQPALKFDMANLLHQRSVSYAEPPEIRTIGIETLIISYLIIAGSMVIQLWLLYFSLANRRHSVLQLSQVWFLVALQLAGLVATPSAIFFNPLSDLFCLMEGPMTLIPLQLMFAITLGRLHRIVVIMKPLMEWREEPDRRRVRKGLKSWRRAFMGVNQSPASSQGEERSNPESSSDLFENDRPPRWHRLLKLRGEQSRPNIRQEYNAVQLDVFISVVTFPVILFEAIGVVLLHPTKQLHMNEVGSVGRYECGCDRDQLYSLSGTCVLVVTLLFSLIEARKCRQLPAFFNESERVIGALLSSLFVACMGYSIVFVSNEPSAYPDAAYIMEVFTVCFITAVLPLRLLLPKLRLIWEGETVAIGSILQEHKVKMEQRKQHSTLGLPEREAFDSRQEVCLSKLSASLSKPFSKESFQIRHSSQEDSADESTEALPRTSDCQSTADLNDEKHPNESFSGHSLKGTEKRTSRRRKPKKIPSDQDVMLCVVQHSKVVSRVTERLLSGLRVEGKDWDLFESSMDELGGLLWAAKHKGSNKHKSEV